MTYTASLKTSCTALRSNLICVKSFASRYSYQLLDTSMQDPVLFIQHLCCSGLPLCYLFNLLPDRFFPKINVDYEATDEHSRNMAVALFAMNARRVLGCQYFTLADILATEGLQKVISLAVRSKMYFLANHIVKAVHALFAITQLLPDSEFDRGNTSYPTTPTIPLPITSTYSESSQTMDVIIWSNRVRSMLNSERRYVKDMEIIEV
jgi:hypothetical protein